MRVGDHYDCFDHIEIVYLNHTIATAAEIETLIYQGKFQQAVHVMAVSTAQIKGYAFRAVENKSL